MNEGRKPGCTRFRYRVWAGDDTKVHRSSADVWAVGHMGTAVHFDGREWSKVATVVATDLLGGLADPDGTVWLAGPSTILPAPTLKGRRRRCSPAP